MQSEFASSGDVHGMRTRPALKPASARVCADWLLLPWIASADELGVLEDLAGEQIDFVGKRCTEQ